MASIVDRSGVQADVLSGPDQSEEALGLVRSIVIVGLKSQGYNSESIGRVMNLSGRHVKRLYRDVPHPSRGFYASAATR